MCAVLSPPLCLCLFPRRTFVTTGGDFGSLFQLTSTNLFPLPLYPCSPHCTSGRLFIVSAGMPFVLDNIIISHSGEFVKPEKYTNFWGRFCASCSVNTHTPVGDVGLASSPPHGCKVSYSGAFGGYSPPNPSESRGRVWRSRHAMALSRVGKIFRL